MRSATGWALRRRIAALTATFAIVACGDAPIPVLTGVPDFALERQDGESFGSANLRGRPWVANFIFTTCPSICPTLTSQMANLERRTREVNAQFVSFSVDPENDRPEVLRAYAASHDANLDRWAFLTGDTDAMRSVIEEGMRMRMGDRAADGDILHGGHFVLVDGQNRIRGFYRNDGAELERLEADLRRLSAE
ncbi:MAG: SCO family protein [Myxococcota bacterium]